MSADLYLLDSGPLGLVTNPRESEEARRCKAWLREALAGGARVMVPEVVDYELRRELLRADKAKGLARLDAAVERLGLLAVDHRAWRLAAELWAEARRSGRPTAKDAALDADLLIAAAARLASRDGVCVVVTDNPGHLGRFCEVADWRDLAGGAAGEAGTSPVAPPGRLAKDRPRGPIAIAGGDAMIVPLTDAQNVKGKAYTIREGETLAAWLRRGAGESGEAREKFKATIYHNLRIALRDRVIRRQILRPFDPPDPEVLRAAYDEVRAWLVAIVREAGLDEWTAELLPAAARWAYETVAAGPMMSDLVVDRMSVLLDPSGGGSPDVIARALDRDPQAVADASSQATQWARDAIVAAKVAPDNPHGEDDEAIARAILARVRAERG